MNLQLTEEQDLVIAMVRRFVREEILPLELHLDPDAEELSADDNARLIEKTKAMGLYGLDIPPEFGGPDIDLVTRTLMAVEMAQHRAGLYVPCYGTFGGAGLAQLFEATDEQKEKYLFPTLRGENGASSVCPSRPGGQTLLGRFRPRQYKTEMTGSSMGASCGLAALIKHSTVWCLREQLTIRAEMG